jgi:hypothetical protein
MQLLGPVNLIILGWECQGFLMVGFGKGLIDTRSGTIDHLGSIHFSYTWLRS